MDCLNFFRKLFVIVSLVLISFPYVHAVDDIPSVYSTVKDNYKEGKSFSFDDFFKKISTSLAVGTDPDGKTPGYTNMEGLIFSYCNSVLMNTDALIKDGFLYSAKQSSFVYLLCKNIDPNLSSFFASPVAQFTGYFKVSDFDKLGLPVGKDKRYLAYLYVDDLFNNLMNEYFVIKQANIYGLQTDNEEAKSLKDQVREFSRLYFDGIELCNKDQSPGIAKALPKTCKYMTQYLSSAKKMFKDLNILSASGLYADYKNITNCGEGAVITGYNIVLCGLRGDSHERSLSPFINILYNELFYYNLFVKYFGMQLTKNPLFFRDATMNNGVGTIKEQQVSRVNQMNTELEFSKQAVGTSLRILRNAYVTFPLHIGFLMYWEGLQEFGKSLAPIATPVYTLYDKFRNVQCIRK